jgi:hypothetical protein
MTLVFINSPLLCLRKAVILANKRRGHLITYDTKKTKVSIKSNCNESYGGRKKRKAEWNIQFPQPHVSMNGSDLAPGGTDTYLSKSIFLISTNSPERML